MPSPFRNPHYRAAAILARLAVNWASAVWSIVVLSKPDALQHTAYASVGRFINEDLIAGVLLTLAVVQSAWIVMYLRPIALGAVGYALMTCWWLFVLIAIAISDAPIQPTALATVSTVVALAVFGFVANPVRDEHAGAR